MTNQIELTVWARKALAGFALACALVAAPVSAWALDVADSTSDVSLATVSIASDSAPEGSGEEPSPGSALAMHRVYNPNSGEHFYTADVAERDYLVVAGWHDEGAGWMAPRVSDTPVYRLYSGTDHHYTTDFDEKEMLVEAGWSDEGIGWYSDDEERVPLLRQYNPYVNPSTWRNNSGSHNFTTSAVENDALVQVGWLAEGVGWYGTDHVLYAGSYGAIERDDDIWIETSPYYEVHVASQVGDDITMDIVSSGRNRTPLCVAGCSATVVDGTATFTYIDNFGNSGTGTLVFGDDQVTVKVEQTATVDATATLACDRVLPRITRSEILQGIRRTPDQMRARMNITEDYRACFDHGDKSGIYQRYIVLHDTEGDGIARWVVEGWEADGRGVAAHFIVNKDGTVVQCVPMDRIAHHAGWGNSGHNAFYGVDEWRDDKVGTLPTISDLADYGMNSWSIGIEMVHVGGSGYYPETQLVAVDQLIAYIDSYYGFHSTIIDHKDWRNGNSDTSPEFADYLRNYKDHGSHYPS